MREKILNGDVQHTGYHLLRQRIGRLVATDPGIHPAFVLTGGLGYLPDHHALLADLLSRETIHVVAKCQFAHFLL